MKVVDRVLSIPHSTLKLDWTESTAYLGALWALRAQHAPSKAVDLGHLLLNGLPLIQNLDKYF